MSLLLLFRPSAGTGPPEPPPIVAAAVGGRRPGPGRQIPLGDIPFGDDEDELIALLLTLAFT